MRPTVVRSRCPCNMRVNLARLVFQPVLFGVASCQPQIPDHRVDVIFKLRHLAAHLDLKSTASGHLSRHRSRHFGDSAHLRRKIGGQQVHVAGERLPGTAAPGTFA